MSYEALIEERTTSEESGWFVGLEAGTPYGLEVIAVAGDGTESDPYFWTDSTSAAEAPPDPPMDAMSEPPGTSSDGVGVEWEEVESAHSYTLRLVDGEGQVVDSVSIDAMEPGTAHAHTLTGTHFTAYDVELVAHNEHADTTATMEAGPHYWRGGGVELALAASHVTGTPWTYDRDTRYPAYMAGRVFVDGEAKARDVLILDRRTYRLLYRPRVHADGTWEVANLVEPPRRDWRAYMVIARDPQARYNSQIIDHVKPVIMDPDL